MTQMHCPEWEALTVQLLVILDEYEEGLDQLVLKWEEDADWELYAQVSASVDEVRNFCRAQPRLSVPFLELLMSHVDLMRMLCRKACGADQPTLPASYADHRKCIKSLRDRCRRLSGEGP